MSAQSMLAILAICCACLETQNSYAEGSSSPVVTTRAPSHRAPNFVNLAGFQNIQIVSNTNINVGLSALTSARGQALLRQYRELDVRDMTVDKSNIQVRPLRSGDLVTVPVRFGVRYVVKGVEVANGTLIVTARLVIDSESQTAELQDLHTRDSQPVEALARDLGNLVMNGLSHHSDNPDNANQALIDEAIYPIFVTYLASPAAVQSMSVIAQSAAAN